MIESEIETVGEVEEVPGGEDGGGVVVGSVLDIGLLVGLAGPAESLGTTLVLSDDDGCVDMQR